MRSWTLPDRSLQISAEAAVRRAALCGASLLDVRAPIEFKKGAVPGATNLAILEDHERASVGLTYKTEGQEAAIERGETLTHPEREARVARWKAWSDTELARDAETAPILYCARGGMRSSIAQNWLREAGGHALRVERGYKALRRELLGILERPFDFVVVGGFTGSAKSLFLRGLATKSPAARVSFVDLEEVANHKGSAFGKPLTGEQPTTHDFENILALRLLAAPAGKPVLVEDESKTIGKVRIPNCLYGRISDAPLVRIDLSLEERAEFLVEDYVRGPERDVGTPRLTEFLLDSLHSIREKLGDERHRKAETLIRKGMETGDAECHRDWITLLLREYYDPMYAFAMERKDRKEIFAGRPEAVREFLLDIYK